MLKLDIALWKNAISLLPVEKSGLWTYEILTGAMWIRIIRRGGQDEEGEERGGRKESGEERRERGGTGTKTWYRLVESKSLYH